jgi:hypothetical protein
MADRIIMTDKTLAEMFPDPRAFTRAKPLYNKLVLATLLCLGAVGCHSSAPNQPSAAKATVLHALSDGPESLTGQYGAEDKGKMLPFIRISHPASSGPFVIEEFAGNKWQVDKQTGRPLTREEFTKLVGAGIDVPFAGLVLGQTAFIKVPEGWQQGKFKTKTGYLFFTALGPIELTKM